jgi:DNA/RNA-binding domain of Phe-tRNA-synthetase-like protein
VVTFLRLSDEVVESFPEAMIRIVVTHGLRNADHWEETTRQLEDTELAAREGRVELPGESHPAIASWHEAYRKFGTILVESDPVWTRFTDASRAKGGYPV